ncbi:HAD family hydrolase [Brevibacterium sp. CFH 10365]|uniref:HAD family hydrolase n=1 Tax=Brevibacterium sp. CFH 10365 TaxID=2585207 RepID=UPI0012667E54|nr:HAD family hydrolase [Brevibacterium sp. CFH 10365]
MTTAETLQNPLSRTGEARDDYPTPTLRPEALLLDFGGVVFSTHKRPGGGLEVARIAAELLAKAGHLRSPDELASVFAGGGVALRDWKNSQSRLLEPAELDHRTIWRDFYASPLPVAEREVLVGHAGELQRELTTRSSEHTLRPGLIELLDTAAELGVPVGIVSNAHSGRAHRAIVEEAGLSEKFAVQLYSDEVGIRKPHPGIIDLAARALATSARRCWYVGDTLDRDVVAGRRAGVAAVMVTRSHHTDSPPFPVAERADLVVDDPRGIVPALRRTVRPSSADTTLAEAVTDRSVRAVVHEGVRLPSALLLDHGGVISTSEPDELGLATFTARLADGLTAAGHLTTVDQAASGLAAGRIRHKEWKDAHESVIGGPVPEIDPITFWAELVGPGLPGDPDAVAAWLHAEAHRLMYDFARVKSARTLRPGIVELLHSARDLGIPVGIVSNTVSGRAVRSLLESQGLLDLIAAHAYSDEVGRRKPDPLGVRNVLTAVDADPLRAWFVGDKPHRDVPAARAGGVGNVVIVRGGATGDEELEETMASDPALRPDHLLDSIEDLLPLVFPPAASSQPDSQPTATSTKGLS